MNKEVKKKKKFYVYRFKNKDDVIIYVGRTVDLNKRFKGHEHLTDDVETIEYIECKTYADMVWKEIYYINLFKNNLTTNVTDVYDHVTDLNFTENWKLFNTKIIDSPKNKKENFKKFLQLYKSIPKGINYGKLINIIDNDKINAVGNDFHALSQFWYYNVDKNSNKKVITQLRKNTYNYFNNICKSLSKDNLWTVYLRNKKEVADGGYTKGYINMDVFDINHHNEDKINLAYLCNDFVSKDFKSEFNITDDQYALYKILSFIFSSALYSRKQINLYVPSSRMRKILTNWLKEN